MKQQDKGVKQEILNAAERVANIPGDTSNAKFFAALCHKKLAYVHAWGEWLVWDGTRWRRDDAGRVVKLAKRAVLMMYAVSRSRGFPRKLRAPLRRQAVATESREGKLKAMIRLAESDLPIAPDKLDRDPMLLNVENGTIDLCTGELRAHNPADFITKLAPVRFDPDALCPHWDRYIAAVLPDEGTRQFFQRFAGYCLTGSVKEQVMAVMFGRGSNGKTTAVNAIADVLGGDYAIRATPDLIMVKKNQSHPTERADLFGRRLAVVPETEDGKRLAESFVKDATGGDRMRARWVFENNFEFEPTHKIVVCTNHLPEVRGTDHGVWRRLRIVPFTATFWNPDADPHGPDELRQDKDLPAKLKAEASGILKWMLDGVRDWRANGMPASDEMQRVCGDYRTEQDTVGQFLRERTAAAEGQMVSATDLYAAYRVYAAKAGAEVLNNTQFGKSLTERGYQKKISNGTKYVGLRLLTEGLEGLEGVSGKSP